MMNLRPGTLLSRFRILSHLGSGGMGEVYRAVDTVLHREIALKLLPTEVSDNQERIQKFFREAEILAALNHPNVVTIHSLEEASGVHFLVTECVEGKTLDSLIPENGLPLRKILDIAIPIAEGLSAAHHAGIIHRDLKPSNVMVSESGRVKILDFGLAVAERPSPAKSVSAADTAPLSDAGPITGTVFYMSPEQLQGQPADPRSDVFSFGVLLYEMCTGKKPFSGDNLVQLIAAILRDEPVPMKSLNPALPEQLVWVVGRCLEKKPEDRLQSMSEVRNEISDVRRMRFKREEEKHSIAVLPFRDMSAEHDQEHFCEGIADELILALSRVEGLRVASRTASFQCRNANLDIHEIGRKLKVEAVLEGSVRKSEDRLRVTGELVSVSDGYSLWTERYDREGKDIFAIQDEITESIVHALTASLLQNTGASRNSTPDLLAYDFYLRGRKFYYQYDRKGIEFALQMFTRSIELDPNYARAYCGIADCCSYLYANAGKLPQDLHKADGASQKALELAPDLAEAHASRAVILSQAGRAEEADREFETAIGLNPDLFEARYFYARHCFTEGKLEKAARMYQQASLVRPEDYQAPLLVAQVYADLGKSEEAQEARCRGVAIAEEHLKLNPDDIRALYMGANGLVALGNRQKGLDWAGRAMRLEPVEPMVLYNLACIYSLAEEYDQAVDCLENAIRNGFTYGEWLDHDSNLDPVRKYPRFQALLHSLRTS